MRVSVLSHLRVLGHCLLDLVYPPQCAACRAPVDDARQLLCPACWDAIAATSPSRCPRCSCPLDGDRRAADEAEAACPNCGRWDPAWGRLLVMGAFEGPLQHAIHAAKFKQNRKLCHELGRRLAACPDLAEGLSQLAGLVPVPLHPARQRERGYNQSRLIARGVAEVLDIPICDSILRRSRSTRQQAMLDAGERQANLEGAFSWTGQLMPGGCLAVVDDVVTTGATLDACARALLAAGARDVWGLAIASPFRQSLD